MTQTDKETKPAGTIIARVKTEKIPVGPGTVKLRESNRGALRELFESFLKRSSLADMSLLETALRFHESEGYSGYDECRFADAVLGALGISSAPDELDDVLIVTQENEEHKKMTARALVEDTRRSFNTFIQFASAADVHVLNEALGLGESNSSIVVGFFRAIGMDVPNDNPEVA